MKKISLLTIALIALVLCMDMAQAEHLVLQEEKQECAPNELSLENLSNEEEPQQQMQQRKTSTFVFKEEAAVKGKVRVKLSEEAALQVEKKNGQIERAKNTHKLINSSHRSFVDGSKARNNEGLKNEASIPISPSLRRKTTKKWFASLV